jgi:hypothetical protein
VDEIRPCAARIPVPSDPGTTGLIAYYAMNGDVQDGSGNGNNGTIVGEPSYVDGMTGFGKALAFDGVNDCVDLGNKAVFNPTGSFSVSLWAKSGLWDRLGPCHDRQLRRRLGWQIRRHSSTSLCDSRRGSRRHGQRDDSASERVDSHHVRVRQCGQYEDHLHQWDSGHGHRDKRRRQGSGDDAQYVHRRPGQ